MTHTLESVKPHTVIRLAAQAGVRHSLHRPIEYVDSNVVGFMHLLEGCRHHDVEHLVYASSSSIYGVTSRTPFSEHHPVSIYAATKRAGEFMAHTYSHLFELPATGLWFFSGSLTTPRCRTTRGATGVRVSIRGEQARQRAARGGL